MPDEQYPVDEQRRKYGVVWDQINSFSPHMDFWDFYQKAVDAAPPGATIVEVGCYKGRSLVCLGLMASEANKGLKVYGVDDNTMGCNAEAERNLMRAGLGDFVTFLPKPSVEAAKDFADESVWLAFIDGGHLHEIVEADIRAWMPKIAPDGWLAGHDALMHTVAEPVHALLGVENVITDNIDIWAVRKQPVRDGVDIRTQSYRPTPIPGSWKP